jgi:ABC-2 type transport system ATP-binding protein
MLEEVVLERARSGATIVFSTHVMQHAERLCDQLILVARGRKVFQGDQAAARARLPTRLTISARHDPAGLPGVVEARAGGTTGEGWTDYELSLAPGADAGDLLELCTSRGFPLRRFETRQASLHDVFLHVVGEAEGRP